MTTSDDAARERLRGQVTAAAGQAAADGRHPGHWHLHYIALPSGAAGDFTPYRAPDYAEEEHAVHEPLLEWLAGLAGIDYAAAIGGRAAEADKEAGQ